MDDYEEGAKPDVTVYLEIKDAECAYTIDSRRRRKKAKITIHVRRKVTRAARSSRGEIGRGIGSARFSDHEQGWSLPKVIFGGTFHVGFPGNGQRYCALVQARGYRRRNKVYGEDELLRGQDFAETIPCVLAHYLRMPQLRVAHAMDRAGLVISEPFDFIQQPELLHRFFYRFACMTDIERGCDPTVNPATEAEIGRMRAFTNYDTTWHKAKFLGSVDEGPVMKISVPAANMIPRGELERGKKDEQTSGSSEPVPPREFLVGKPVFMSNPPTGSGTKGFIAYDVAEDRLAFLKDCWRPEAETYHPEGEVYLHLHSHHAHYIATPVGAGDVVDDCGGIHTTRAEKYVGGPRWRHYRLILEEVAMPLEEYTTSYEFVDVMYCAVQGLS
ncbi:hypothetical protein FOMPIDRAFT_1052770 [Fomitopsis schrenkii]|uniref:Fungal-type protein kinase domain-containing protein n=1 Tax=Fomitopsis schrenkii TaxID=2126942 RepID=S8E0Y7_FOMSC|nr:hypothetical protein FOMPIDRAFT_1052770 [Fomitopsis schrenkii]